MLAGLDSASSSANSFDNSFILADYTSQGGEEQVEEERWDWLVIYWPSQGISVIDGATLAFALQDSVKGLFLEVAKYCKYQWYVVEQPHYRKWVEFWC